MSRIVDENYGKKLEYDPDFKGPKRYRSCTDLCCLLLFFSFLVGWGAVGFYAFKHGDISFIFLPKDSSGRMCGRDPGVADKKYLFFFDLTQCVSLNYKLECPTPQICINKCPEENWSVNLNQNFNDKKQKLICKTPEIAQLINSAEALRRAIQNNECASYYIKSHSIANRCIPNPSDIQGADQFLIEQKVNKTELINGAKVLQYYEQAGIIFNKVMDDARKTYPLVLYVVLSSLVISVFYIILLRWLSGIMIWTSLFSFLICLGVAFYACYKKYEEVKTSPASEFVLPASIINTSIYDYIEAADSSVTFWFWVMIIVGVLLFVSVTLIVCLRKRIRVAIALIKEGSKAIGSTLSSLAFPIIPWILDLIVIAWFVLVFLHLYSLGKALYKVQGLAVDTNCDCNNKYKDDDWCNLKDWKENCHNKTSSGSCSIAKCKYVPRDSDKFIDYLHGYNIFGVLWGMAFVSGFSQMVLASVFARWYWTMHKKNVPFFVVFHALITTVSYHLGTIAFGSLLIAICEYIRLAIEYVQKTCKKYQDNPVAKAIIWCFRCFFTLLEAVLRFFSRNAYIMCAIHGTNFTTSAKDAFGLLSRNVIRVVVVGQVTSILFFIGKVVLTAIMAGLSYYLFMIHLKDFSSQLNYPGVPIVIISIFSFLIASTFFKVYTMAIETLFICFCEDSERNDGTQRSPYYMSKSLKKVLHGKNV